MQEYGMRVIISSTAHDLPEYRKAVLDACMRQNMIPIMTERQLTIGADVIADAVKLVESASLYIGIFAYDNADIPIGNSVSVAEAEYRRAVERQIPRLIFLTSTSPADVFTL